jgi:hypothetical protein
MVWIAVQQGQEQISRFSELVQDVVYSCAFVFCDGMENIA